MSAIPPSERETETPRYTGGEARVDANLPVCHLAIAFETPGGWNSDNLVPLTLLQTILGGGGSFSTGGPGKGMYTRLYLEGNGFCVILRLVLVVGLSFSFFKVLPLNLDKMFV